MALLASFKASGVQTGKGESFRFFLIIPNRFGLFVSFQAVCLQYQRVSHTGEVNVNAASLYCSADSASLSDSLKTTRKRANMVKTSSIQRVK
jgi:hypothetical protein